MSNYDTAMKFFEACETGKGWDACKAYCREGATFSCQAGALDRADVDEHVLAAAFGLDKSEPFGGVEPFHGAIGHRGSLLNNAARGSAAARLCQSWSKLEPFRQTGIEGIT